MSILAMDLPPEQYYDSREALFVSINTWATTRGYAFIARRSTKEKNGKSTITCACDRSCLSPALKERQRKTTTRGIGCPFSVIAKESSDGGWTLKHRPDRRFSVHNHERSQHPSAHPVHRTGIFSRVYGLPCLHILNALQGALLLNHFHSHWHLKRDGAPQLLLEPRQRIEPIRALSSLPSSSTKREPSQFEVVEAQVTRPRRAPSRCTKCNAVGHTRTSKACPLRYLDIL